MVAVKLMNFGGMIPAVDERLLPKDHASLSENTWLYTGALEGMWTPRVVHTLSNPDARKVYRIPFGSSSKDRIQDSTWMEFDEQDVDVLKSPVASDSFERFYICGQGVAPAYNTKARIIANSASFILGVPAPATAPVVAFTGGAGLTEYRAYTYTWVTAYGEEGPPAPPQSLTTFTSATWDITLTAPTAGDTTGRNLTHVRIYRTITGVSGATSYFRVVELPIATLVYADTVPTLTVTGNPQLDSTFWTGPPTDLVGLTQLPNGIMVSWRNNEIWFSVPYRPHAWPAPYVLTVEYPIVGIGAFGQSAIICTTNATYIASGVNPAAFTLSRVPGLEPCTSRGSIVSTPRGVAYASENGLVLVTPGALQLITKGLIDAEEWQDSADYLSPETMRAATLGAAYYCWGSVLTGVFDIGAFDDEGFAQGDFSGSYRGALIDLENQRVSFNKMYSVSPTVNCFSDPWSGEVLLIRDGEVLHINRSDSTERELFTWRSKIMETPDQRNFGAMRIYFETYSFSPALNPVRNVAQDQEPAADQWGVVRVFADGRLVVVRELRTSGEIMRLPSGFKATFWEVEVEARIKVLSVEIATTAKELGSV